VIDDGLLSMIDSMTREQHDLRGMATFCTGPTSTMSMVNVSGLPTQTPDKIISHVRREATSTDQSSDHTGRLLKVESVRAGKAGLLSHQPNVI